MHIQHKAPHRHGGIAAIVQKIVPIAIPELGHITAKGFQKIQGVDPPGNAAFAQYIAVEITCDYDPITPVLLRLNQTVQIHVKSLMYSEAN